MLLGSSRTTQSMGLITPGIMHYTIFTFPLQNNYGHFSFFSFKIKKKTYFKIITYNFDLTKLSKLISFLTILLVEFWIRSKMFWCNIYCHCISCLGWYNYEQIKLNLGKALKKKTWISLLRFPLKREKKDNNVFLFLLFKMSCSLITPVSQSGSIGLP